MTPPQNHGKNSREERVTREVLSFRLLALSFLRLYRQILWATDLIQILILGLVKLSFLFLYRRVFNTGSGGLFNIATKGLIGVVIVWTISLFFAHLFMCGVHFSAFYILPPKEEKLYCVNTTMLNVAYSISDVIIDILTIILPLPLVSCFSRMRRAF